MKKLFFALAFMLIGTFAFANTNEAKGEKIISIENILNSKKEGVLLVEYSCTVDNGIVAARSTGRTARQACRRARRLLRKFEQSFS